MPSVVFPYIGSSPIQKYYQGICSDFFRYHKTLGTVILSCPILRFAPLPCVFLRTIHTFPHGQHFLRPCIVGGRFWAPALLLKQNQTSTSYINFPKTHTPSSSTCMLFMPTHLMFSKLVPPLVTVRL